MVEKCTTKQKYIELLNKFGSKYIKKPIPIRAVQINEPFEVDTLEGKMVGKPGDYLVEGVKGELYICDREIFELTYDKIDDRFEELTEYDFAHVKINTGRKLTL